MGPGLRRDDVERVGCITSFLPRAERHRCPQIYLREWEAQGTSLSIKRGRRNAERRTLVTAAACFPDRRETEAHGNAFRRPPRRLKTLVRSSGDLADPRRDP